MESKDTPRPTLAALKESWRELPFHELIEVDASSLTDDEKRVLVSVLQEQRQSPQKRRSSAKRQAKKLTGKDKTVDVTDIL